MAPGKFSGAKSTLAAGMLALLAVFAQVATDTAFAQVAPQPVAVQQVKVPMLDGRGAEPAGLGLAAANASNDALAVVVRTANPAVLEAVKDGGAPRLRRVHRSKY